MARPAVSPDARSVRLLKVGEQVRHVLSELLTRQHVHDEVLSAHSVSVTEVRMSPDLRLATAYVVPLGGRDEKEVLAALDRNKRFFRSEIAHRVNLKFAPDLRFRIDDRFEEAMRIEKILDSPKVRRDLAKGADADE